MLKDSAQKILRQAILTREKCDLPFFPSYISLFFLVKVDILHGFLLNGIVGWKNLQLVSLGRFVVAKMLPVKSFSYKNVLSHFLF